MSTPAPAEIGHTAGPLRRAWTGLRWYLREVSGEGRWDAYVARCRDDGVVPMSRRDFERQRDHERECAARGKCC